MKKSLSMPVLAVIGVVAIVALIVVFGKMSGDPEPTATNVPDYSKMSPAEVSAAYAKSKGAEQDARKDVPAAR